ncbi:MAG: prepilin-type N-terminal cleavage/methylation domain-containing protein [Planctomycetes bacterium]|nr:prepilin-type N-terminal cleavage/methylation domain-containing protein [Planctomycetota bacterium]
MSDRRPASAAAGFTLIEVLVAMSVLLIGMTGIITLFSTGLGLERRGSLAVDAAVALEDVMPEVRRQIEERLGEDGGVDAVDLPRNPIPGWVGLDYLARARRMPESNNPSAWMLEVRVIPRGVPEDQGLSYGYLPARFGRTYETLVREAEQEKLTTNRAGQTGRREPR